MFLYSHILYSASRQALRLKYCLYHFRYLELGTRPLENENWNLPQLLERFPSLKTLKFHTSFHSLSNRDIQDPPFSQVSMRHPLESLVIPRDNLKSSWLCWLLFNCPRLNELSVYDMLVDYINPLTIGPQAIIDGIEMGAKLKSLTIASMTSYRYAEFPNIFGLLPSLRWVEIGLYGGRENSSAINGMLLKFVKECSHLKRLKIVNKIDKCPKITLPTEYLQRSALEFIVTPN